jgi:hypothetical protein
MMTPEDIRLLKDMRERVTVFREGRKPPVGAADQLALLRDMLQFRDREWDHKLTQHLATLDSASTFVPQNGEQSKQATSAIAAAVKEILGLIDDKL